MILTENDAIHIKAPWTHGALCGEENPRNLASFEERWVDDGGGCWTCLDARRWIEDYAKSFKEVVG